MKSMLVIITLAVLVFFGRPYFQDIIFNSSEERYSSSEVLLKTTLGGHEFSPPLNKIRHKHQRYDGPAKVLDLFFLWPNLQGYSEETANIFDDPSQNWRIVLATMDAVTTPIPSQQTRLNSVYRRFFKGAAWRGPNGLLGQKLDPASGYSGEDIYYGRDGDTVFVTRCLNEEAAKNADVSETCLHDFELVEGIQVVIRFDKNLLADWRLIPSAIKRELLGMMQN